MNPPIVILRPEPGASASLQAAAALGLDAYAFPLFHTVARAWDAPSPDAFDALLLGSANALRHGGEGLNAYAGKPTYCVGDVTTQAALSHGFSIAAQGSGGLQDVLDKVGDHARLLRLSGEERVALCPPPGVTVEERVVYASLPAPMPVELARLMGVAALPGLIVMLHSGAAARHFIAECARLGLSRSRITAITIGPRVTQICDETGGWRDVLTAQAPGDAAMLALARQTCQTETGVDATGLDGGLAGQ
ncbi:uroporphyrinogen-III synthase [Novosphingobium sp. KACC 22771]|uniref:uroporphyrinogen-III synthase n=1 Tax=Novosphingobium sp. KACC 22771 TaxID=3025670 RepID=UPI0023663C4D|nr:uroporphyrinogen-III synthase [Novosphingobium sp. KACC 22771]WDF73305.1 uroporphyrinogen-III synthase [Novosphingobium sp. KACC 22771]